MSDRIECPDCGHLNSATRVTCKSCKTNLREAFDNADQPIPPKATQKSFWRFVIWVSVGLVSMIIMYLLLPSLADLIGVGHEDNQLRFMVIIIPVILAKGANELLKKNGWI